MTKDCSALTLGLAGLILLAVPAEAQQAQCGPRAAVIKTLAEKYSETRRSIGISANNMVMEMFASDGSRTWTITVTTPQGMTCLVASGQGYEDVVEELPARGDPA